LTAPERVALGRIAPVPASVTQQTYVRFVTGRIDRRSGRRRGVFQAAAALADSNFLAREPLGEMQLLRSWFNRCLDRPARFSRSRRNGASPISICWFKATAVEHVRNVRAMCRILKVHGIATEMITSTRPGYIVFEDDHQIAAVPFAETAT
jgi:hypothetical protein